MSVCILINIGDVLQNDLPVSFSAYLFIIVDGRYGNLYHTENIHTHTKKS